MMNRSLSVFSVTSGLLLAGLVLCAGRPAQAQEALVFKFNDGGIFSGPANSVFSVTGSLQNPFGNTDTLDLTSASLSESGPDFSGGTPPGVTDVFSFNGSGVLAPGQTLSDITFFTVDTTGLPAGTTYAGSVLVSGTDASGSSMFQSNPAALQISVLSNPIPEASTLVSFGVLLLLAGGGLALSARKRRVAGRG